MQYKTTYNSPVGKMTLMCENGSLIGLWISAQKYHGDKIFTGAVQNDDLPVFKDVKEWLNKYFDGKNPDIKNLPIAPLGGGFRQTVWHILCDIPYGQVITYGEIANKISDKTHRKMSARAVGGAVGHNPISVIIPCHRVVGANNNLTGYAGGIDAKIHLLKHEGVDISAYSLPKKL